MTHFESVPDRALLRGPVAASLAVTSQPAPSQPGSAQPESSPTADHVATPRHTSQLVRLIHNARRRGTPIAIRGRAVPATGGAELAGVLTVDLSSWQHVDVPNR